VIEAIVGLDLAARMTRIRVRRAILCTSTNYMSYNGEKQRSAPGAVNGNVAQLNARL
jgi:hypothetical protein